jgi:two-component system response regulator YesN
LYNTSIYQFVIEIRIERAIELVYNKNLSLEQISDSVGYENLSYFSRAFKRMKDIAPNAFRAAM